MQTATIIAAVLLVPSLSNAQLATYFDEPDTVFASNQVVDIIEHEGGVWFATGDGLNFSFDGGQTWLLYDSTNGLKTNSVFSLYSVDSRLWVANGHSEVIGNDVVPFSDALLYTDDTGFTWHEIDFGPTGLDIPYVIGGERAIYDITGHPDEDRNIDWLFFTAFAGGFLASQDGGMSWRRIFRFRSDSTNFAGFYAGTIDTLSHSNRYFSCATDTSHGDSLYVWAGSAGGVFQYVYATPQQKPFSKKINDIAFCDSCPDSGGFVFIAGENGVTRGKTDGAPFISRFETDGLPGPYASALIDFRGKLFVGTMDAEDGNSTGLAVSTDQGDTYSPLSSFTEVIGPNRKISDFAIIRERMYVAAEEAGLFVSADTGETWTKVYVDSLDTTLVNRRNVVHALDVLEDTLRIGTDSGLVTLTFDSTGQVIAGRFDVFPENDSSSVQVIRVKTQLFYDSAGTILDSLAIWTVNRPLTASGTPVVLRSYHDTVVSPMETDTLWHSLMTGYNSSDVNFIGDSAFVMRESQVGEWGIYYTATGQDPNFPHVVADGLDNLKDDNVTVMAVRGDTILFGSDSGFAISNNRGEEYEIFRVNTDSLGADVVVTYANNVPGITGNFIPALAVQYIDNESARVWVSNRPTFSGSEAISVGLVVPVDSFGNVVHPDSLEQAVGFERRWEAVYPDGYAWNFAFNGDSVFAATNAGLLFNHQDTGLTWDTIPLVDSLGEVLVLVDTVYAVEVIGSHLWVGTRDRTLRYKLDNLDYADTVFFVIDSSDEVYSFPLPFSHSRDPGVDFHFIVDRPANITLKIYDFAMNLVTTVVDNVHFPAGIYPASGGQRKTWDGRNDLGAAVAVGTYYFKVEYSTGEVRWGKIAVVP